MTTSVFTQKYAIFRKLLVQYRKDVGLTQQILAQRIGRPQSFVSKYESGERRIDLIEFLGIASALNFDVHEFINLLEKEVMRNDDSR